MNEVLVLVLLLQGAAIGGFIADTLWRRRHNRVLDKFRAIADRSEADLDRIMGRSK